MSLAQGQILPKTAYGLCKVRSDISAIFFPMEHYKFYKRARSHFHSFIVKTIVLKLEG